MFSKRFKTYAVIFCFIISVAAISFLSYRYADKITSYEMCEKSSFKTPTEAKQVQNIPASIPEEIPFSEIYRVNLKDGYICVTDSTGAVLYSRKAANTDMFTVSDIKQLERDGFTYTVRSELLEMLNYISS